MLEHIKNFPLYVGAVYSLSVLSGMIYILGYFNQFEKTAYSFVHFEDYLNIATSALPANLVVFLLPHFLFPIKSASSQVSELKGNELIEKINVIQKRNEKILFFFKIATAFFVINSFLFFPSPLALRIILAVFSVIVFFYVIFNKHWASIKSIFGTMSSNAIVLFMFLIGCFWYGEGDSFRSLYGQTTYDVINYNNKNAPLGKLFLALNEGVYIIEDNKLVFRNNDGLSFILSTIPKVEKRTSLCKYLDVCMLDRLMYQEKI